MSTGYRRIPEDAKYVFLKNNSDLFISPYCKSITCNFVRLKGTKFYVLPSSVGPTITWSVWFYDNEIPDSKCFCHYNWTRQADAMIPFEQVLESLPENIQEKLLFHLEKFIE